MNGGGGGGGDALNRLPLLFCKSVYFKLYGRLTARENYTIGSLIFRNLIFNFYISGASVLQKLYSRVVKTWGFLYFRVRGKAQHSDSLSLFIGSPPLGSALLFHSKLTSYIAK